MNAGLPDPFAVGQLDVGDGHVLYHEQVGNPSGLPIVYMQEHCRQVLAALADR